MGGGRGRQVGGGESKRMEGRVGEGNEGGNLAGNAGKGEELEFSPGSI